MGKAIAIVTAGLLVFGGAALAAEKTAKPEDPAHVRKSIEDHLAMAEAHLHAAQCLKAGKAEKVCHAQLEKDCKGLAVGKYCGMKHSH